LPEIVIARVWRELITAFTRLQGPLKVAICAPEKSVGYWDLGRMQFGSATPMTLYRSNSVVLRAVSAMDGTIGVLPLPEEGEKEPWWPQLAVETKNAPRVIARLPFVQDYSFWFEGLGAMAIAPIEHVDSGNDVSLIVIVANPQISRARLHEHLSVCKMPGQIIAGLPKEPDQAEWLHLVEVEGYLRDKDPRIKAFVKKSDGAVDRIVRIGGYASPIPVDSDEA
jgi:hypothetical protein